ncbi:MAG: 50S ribosomal protein L25/general stress protein Ctc [Gammaproteobacteria bacterium]|nr:50S ribosomal protein L25/general stress protein Ctc [Gammaproteobacteria bacterium]
MSHSFLIEAEVREDMGKGASRRLRRTGRIPGVLYGGDKAPLSLSLDHDTVLHQLEHEAFYSTILELSVGGKKEKVVLKDLQRHSYKPLIMHVDLQRVSSKDKLRMHVPLHFIGEETCPGVKQGGVVSHLLTDVEVTCLPKDLPEAIEVDMSGMGLNETLKMSDMVLPKGVELVELSHGEGHDQGVVSVHTPHVKAEPAEGAAGEAEAPAEGE